MVDFTYLGIPPNLAQSQPDFDVNTQYFVDYVATLGGKIEQFAGAVLQSTTTTSTTSNTISIGSKTFIVEAGKGFVVGMGVRCANSGSNFMDGIVTSYSGTTLVVNITAITGTGNFASWTIFQSITSGASLGVNKFTGLQTLADEVTVPSASTLDLTTANSNNIIVSGSVTITAITMPRGAQIKARFTGTPILTHGLSLVLPASVNYTITANDIVTFTNQNGVVYAEISSYPTLNSINDPTFSSISAKSPISPNWLNGRFNVTGIAPLYACRAWANFNGIGTIEIRASGNILSITDNGIGDYTANFIISMPDENYSFFGTAKAPDPNTYNVSLSDLSNPTVSSVRFKVESQSATETDCEIVMFGIIR